MFSLEFIQEYLPEMSIFLEQKDHSFVSPINIHNPITTTYK